MGLLSFFKKLKYSGERWTPQALHEPGNICLCGDSNVHGCNVKQYYNPYCFNEGQGGQTTMGFMLSNWLMIKSRHEVNPIDKIILQIGGNNFWLMLPWSNDKRMQKIILALIATGQWSNMPIPRNDTQTYWAGMEQIITEFLKVWAKDKIFIVSLPWVDPSLKNFNGMKVADLLEVGNRGLKGICEKYGVAYVDIYNPLKAVWKPGRWCDAVHYGDYGRKVVALLISKAVGIPLS
jgi:hypothetical protein